MTETTNYYLLKPDYTDKSDIWDINDNMDTIDTALHTTDGEIDALAASLVDEEAARAAHSNRTDNPHGVTCVQVGAATAEELTTHKNRADNPHGVTAAQIGLGNVPNVSTNNQVPTYTEAAENAALSSGEKLSVALGKIAKAIASLISHLANISNPHSVTCLQIGAAAASDLTSHTSSTSNPHGTTATQVGAYSMAEVDALMASAVIPASADLNAYTTDGKFYVKNAADAASLTNAPVAIPFGLVVEKLHLLGCIQKVTPYGGTSSASVPIMYARYCFFYNSTTWRYGDWYVLAQGQAIST